MPQKLIYIAGHAYSGSTFVCALLGVHPDAEPVSEFAKWSTRYSPDKRCACGCTMKDCDFWQQVKRNWYSEMGEHALERYVKLQSMFERIPSIWRNQLLGKPRPADRFSEYAEYTRALLDSIFKVSGRGIIVDSSKKPARLLALSRIPGLELSVIQLTRSAPEYLESSLRRRKRITPSDPAALLKAFRLGLTWSITNLACDFARSASGVSALRVRYDALVHNPQSTLDAIGAAIKLDVSSIQAHVAQQQPVGYQHIAAGSKHKGMGARPLTAFRTTVPLSSAAMRLAFNIGAAAGNWRFETRS